MSSAASVPTLLLVLLAVSVVVLVVGIVMAAKGTGRVRTAGWWIAIVATLFVFAWGTVLAMGAMLSG